MEQPQGTILFSTVGVSSYAFDVFSVTLTSLTHFLERRHTDGVSVNFNAQFVDEGHTITFVSERTGSLRLYQTRTHNSKPEPLPNFPHSLYHDRPVIKNGRLFFVSAYEKPDRWFKSWSAVYSTEIESNREPVRLTPTGFADFSPAISKSGKLIAVASYGSDSWKGDFHDLKTEIAVFDPSTPLKRAVIASNGGWPTFHGDNTLFFHRKADDGWWSVFRLDLTENLFEGFNEEPKRITPSGVHAFTPSASHNGKWIAVATRRKGTKYRHVEIFDLETEKFFKVTEVTNPNLHHYNPFFSPESNHLGYHRFRGESTIGGEPLIMRYIAAVTSPVENLRMVRTPMTFPSFSPNGEYVALNGDFFTVPGLMIMRSDGSKKWTVMKDSGAFYTAWSPKEEGVIYTSVGPIFESSKTTVQIARVSFDVKDLDGRDVVTCEVKLLTRSDVGNNAFPSVSPDGKFLVFRSGRTGHKNLYILDAANGETENGDGIRRLTEGEWIDTMPSWSPNGELIAFSSNRHMPENPLVFSIYLIRPDGTGLRRVYVAGAEDADRERINHVCFSPDSKWLLFTANFGAVLAESVSFPNHFQPYGDLYVCRLDGSGLRRLTCNPFENGTPAWRSENGALDMGSIRLDEVVGDKMSGQFDEPLWLTCDV